MEIIFINMIIMCWGSARATLEVRNAVDGKEYMWQNQGLSWERNIFLPFGRMQKHTM